MVAVLKMPRQQSAEYWAERRNFPRKPMNAVVQGNRVDHTIDARQNPRLRLTLRDLSLGGLSAVSDLPVAMGERLTVTFPANDRTHPWDAFGTVLRCEQTGTGYRLAMEFDPLPAA
ncbi:MAG TPA: PilZ domain-containing protein [Tepidisphaeraceae bacterium]|nr:PilZ domain-containing protein [Tepidisphaeraceae bacterium]